MSDPTASEAPALMEEFRQTLEECEDLYRSAAKDHLLTKPDLGGEAPGSFVARMADLHRGLALKVFVEVAYVDWEWSSKERRLAVELFEHVWDKRLADEQLNEALTHVREQMDLSWGVLLGPFDRLDAFRTRADELQSLVLRLANLIVKIDGRVKPDEARQLKWLQTQLERHLRRVPVAGSDDEPLMMEEVSRDSVPAPPPALADTSPTAQAREGRRAGTQAERDSRRAPPSGAAQQSPEEQLARVLAELDALTGLSGVKQDVRGLLNFLQVQKARARLDLAPTPVTLHSVFRGNPGTGKTTVARLLGRVFGALGLLRRGHLVETDRSGLVAEYAGQTGPKTNKKIDEALDGLLFIDEAYSLVAEKSGEDPYGSEAVQALLKRMEDDRDRLVVVLAGYPKPLERLLQSNPGLSSRFPRTFLFADYSAPELGSIFQGICRKNHYEIPAATRVKLLLGFQHLLDRRDEHFGNGRLARNVFERAILRLANRIAPVAPLTRELLTRLEPDDILLDNVPAEVWGDPTAKDCQFRISCPGCQATCRLKQQLLGCEVQCKRCQTRFPAEWGEPVRD